MKTTGKQWKPTEIVDKVSMAGHEHRNISQPHCYKKFNEEGRSEMSDGEGSDYEVQLNMNMNKNVLSLQREIAMAE